MSTTRKQTGRKSFLSYLGISLRGFFMGAADVVPGVSGGTIALLTGIYDDLLDAISSINLPFIKKLFSSQWREALEESPWKFILFLGLGIATAIFSLARFLQWALAEHPSLLWSFFFGLVLATVFVVSRRVSKPGWHTLGITLATAAVFYLLLGMAPAETPDALWFLFLSGMVAVCAMILPGISGAFILVLLGKYEYVLDAVVHLNIFPLMVIAAGGILGLLSLARLLRWLLRSYYDLTIAALAGIMLGSMRKLWPWKLTLEEMEHGIAETVNILPAELTLDVGIGILLMAFGIFNVLFVEYFPTRHLALRRSTTIRES